MSHRFGIYVRISRDRVGAGLGVERQLEDCQALAGQHGGEVVREYTDNDVSAYRGQRRAGYEDLLADIAAGHVTAVIVWHVDRLTRSPVELERYITVCEPRNVPTYTVRAGELDLATAAGRMTARIIGSVARHESEQKSERVKRQKQQAAAAGKWRGGTRPYGFDEDGVTHRLAEAEIIRDCTRRLLAGETLYSVARTLYAADVRSPRGKRWQPGNLRRVLLRPRNAGLIEHDGAIVGKAEWTPIVDPDSWRALVALMTSEERKPYAQANVSRVLIGSGLYRCYCGELIFSGGLTNNKQMRYRCVTGHLSRTAPPIDEYVHDVIAGVLDKFRAGLLPPTPDLAPLKDRLAALNVRSAQIAEVFADPDGGMTAAQFRTANDKLNRSVAEVEAELARHGGGAVLLGVADAPDPGKAFRDQPLERRRSIIDALATVTVLRASGGRRPDGGYFDHDSVRIEPKRA